MGPRILALANQKGGVGKTTTAINLATALAAIGERVLIIDVDPQGNASTGMGIARQARSVSAYDILLGEARVSDAIVPSSVPGVAMITSTMDLLGVELSISGDADRTFKLHNALADMEDARIEGQPISYVLIDCPPSLNLLTINALAAADGVLIPLQCEFFALEGLSQILDTITQIRTTLNARLRIQGIVMTMFDKRNKLAGQVLTDVRNEMGDLVYNTVIPRNVRLSEAPSYGKPALLYDLKCAGSQAYLRLATEIIRRERQLSAA